MRDSSEFSGNDSVVTTGGATSQTLFAPTAALLSALLSAQLSVASAVAWDTGPDHQTATVTSIRLQNDLAEELLLFHHRLAESQTDLPDDAARVMRENLWLLYD